MVEDGNAGSVFDEPGIGGAGGDTSVQFSSQSWMERIGRSIVGALFGLVLLPVAVVLLGWNEGRAVQTARSLAEGAGLVQEAPNSQLDPAREGRLVHVTGPLRVPGTLADPDFPVRAPGAVHLRRTIQTFQWKEDRRTETETHLGGGKTTITTYSYARVWSAEVIDSSRFHTAAGHQNPTPRYRAATWTAGEATLGSYSLSQPVLQAVEGGGVLPLAGVVPRPGTQVEGDGIYVGRSPEAPQVGDQRVSWQVVRPAELSVIAQQQASGLTAYPTRAGDRLLVVSPGVVSAQEMIGRAEHQNEVLTWVLRAAGAGVMFIGLCLVLTPLSVLADVVPVLGGVLSAGAAVLAVLLTMVGASVVVAVAWVAVRPMLAAAVLGGALLLSALLGRVIRAARRARMPGLVPAR